MPDTVHDPVIHMGSQRADVLLVISRSERGLRHNHLQGHGDRIVLPNRCVENPLQCTHGNMLGGALHRGLHGLANVGRRCVGEHAVDELGLGVLVIGTR